MVCVYVNCNLPIYLLHPLSPGTHEFVFSICDTAAAAAKSLQSCPTLCDPIDGRPPGSPVPGILQAKTLEWVAISFSNAWKWKVKVKSLSRVQLFATPWTAVHQAPPPTGFSRQEYWSGVPLPSPMNGSQILKVLPHQNHLGSLAESSNNLKGSVMGPRNMTLNKLYRTENPFNSSMKILSKIMQREGFRHEYRYFWSMPHGD